MALCLRACLPLGILAAGATGYWHLSKAAEEAKSPPQEAQVIRTNVTRLEVADYQVVVTTQGEVQSHNEVSLSAEVSGQVTYVSPSFEVGSYFSKGDVLVELDARDYLTALAVAEANYLGCQVGARAGYADS